MNGQIDIRLIDRITDIKHLGGQAGKQTNRQMDQGTLKGEGSITVLLISCLTGLESAV
jgi:hypothetical protein